MIFQQFSTESDFEICVNESSVTLSATPAGGTWVSNNGGVLIGSVLQS